MSIIGQSVTRVDAIGKVTGEALYPGDINLPDQAYMKILFAHRPHAIVRSIDTRAAEALPGVIAVFTAKDVPVNEYGLIVSDQPVLCGPGSSKPHTDRVRFIGDQVALVVADSEVIAAQARDLIRVEYEDLPVVTDVLAARQWLDARRGALVEGHGDLRPEHVCLDGEPQVIDCLDFSRALRTQDAVDDLGFLALECTRLGAPSIGEAILNDYRRASGDDAPPAVVRFYQSLRACVRARLAIRHLREPALAQNPLWRERAEAYLGIAQQLVEDGGMP